MQPEIPPFTSDDAYFGVAYRVLYSRWDPDGCVTPEHLEAIRDKATAVLAWADSQSGPFRSAYVRATEHLLAHAEVVLENTRRAHIMRALDMSMPKPPE